MSALSDKKNRNTTLSKTIWSPHQIGVASFLSGPLGGALLLAHNYKALQNQAAAKKSLLFGLMANLLVILASGFFFENIPGGLRYGIALPYVIFLFEFTKKFQGEGLRELIENGAKKGSAFKLVLFSIGLLFLQFSLIVGFLLLFLDPDSL